MTKIDIVSKVFKSGNLSIEWSVASEYAYFCWDLECEDCPCDKEICYEVFSEGITITPEELEEFYELYPEARLV